jgi:hypothetical protein
MAKSNDTRLQEVSIRGRRVYDGGGRAEVLEKGKSIWRAKGRNAPAGDAALRPYNLTFSAQPNGPAVGATLAYALRELTSCK